MLTAQVCLGFSSTCHLCFVKSRKICSLTACLDYWGICLLFLGTTYPFLSFKYSCGPYIIWRYIFTTIISLLTLLCMWATFSERLSNSPGLRSSMFVMFALAGMVPTYGLAIWGDPGVNTLPAHLGRFSISIVLYFVGMLVYLLRAPERWANG